MTLSANAHGPLKRAPAFATHDVLNQPGALEDYNAYTQDKALAEALARFGADWAADHLARTGAVVASRKVQSLARQANRHIPELVTHDRYGRRIDVVEFHPAYHELMGLIFGAEIHCFAWRREREGAHVARGALSYLWNQGENGVCCPMGMTFAAPAALRCDAALMAQWAPLINQPAYDPRPVYAAHKTGVTVGMAMTEKQGGSDLRATLTVARPASARRGPGEPYLLTGHKWFFSVPMSDLFVTLAQTGGGLSCFLATGWMADGSRNRLKLLRLKDKCGNKSNASSEVEFYDLEAMMLGEEGRGLRAIMEMTHLTRLDFAVGSSGLMRQALALAMHHTLNRSAFGRPLCELPAMRNVIADLAVESEAMMWMGMRLCRALDRGAAEPAEAALLRLGTPVAKYWACKRAPQFVAEALECHGGNGFIAEHPIERLYREAPLNGIWEGTGSVVCLDALRATRRAPETAQALLSEVGQARSADRRLDAFAAELAQRLSSAEDLEPDARRIVEMMALALQGSLLVRYAPAAVADAFCATRLGGDWGRAFGTIPRGLDTGAIIERARL